LRYASAGYSGNAIFLSLARRPGRNERRAAALGGHAPLGLSMANAGAGGREAPAIATTLTQATNTGGLDVPGLLRILTACTRYAR